MTNIDMSGFKKENYIEVYSKEDPNTIVLKTNDSAEFNYFRLKVAEAKAKEFYYVTFEGDKVDITYEGQVDGEYPFELANLYEYKICTLSFDADVKVQADLREELTDIDIEPESL